MENPEQLLFTYSEAAKVLSISEHTIKKYVKLKKIAAIRLGRAARISKAEIERVAREGITSD